MAKEYAVVLMEDEESCAVKKVSADSFYQIKDMLNEGEDDIQIIDSIRELTDIEENVLANGLTKQEAHEYAKDISDDFVVLDVY